MRRIFAALFAAGAFAVGVASPHFLYSGDGSPDLARPTFLYSDGDSPALASPHFLYSSTNSSHDL